MVGPGPEPSLIPNLNVQSGGVLLVGPDKLPDTRQRFLGPLLAPNCPTAGVTLEKPFIVSLGRLWDQTQGKLGSVFPAV